MKIRSLVLALLLLLPLSLFAQVGSLGGSGIGAAPLSASPTFTSLTVTGASTLATGSFSGAVTSSKSCATNFVRISPNHCILNAHVADTTLTAATCTTVAAPANATAVQLEVNQLVNTAGNSILTQTFTSNACTSALTSVQTVISTALVTARAFLITAVFSGNFFIQLSGGGTPSGGYLVTGYWD